jgi:colicin import membrane protein
VTATRTHDLLLPQPPGGLVRGAALAVLAHASLLVALTSMVQWRASAPEAVSAELWSAVPKMAAPPARPTEQPRPPTPALPPPPPAPPPPAPAPPPPKAEPVQPDPQIAIAQAKAEREKLERQQQLERERAAKVKAERERERERAEKALKDKQERIRKEREDAARERELAAKQKKAEEQRLAEQRQKNLERLMGQVSGSNGGSTAGTAAKSSGPSASYTGRLIAAIKPNIVFTETISGNPAAEVEVRAGPSGSILARRLIRSSGNKDWDEAVLRAIDRTSSLPRDVDGRVPSTLIMAFRPNE